MDKRTISGILQVKHDQACLYIIIIILLGEYLYIYLHGDGHHLAVFNGGLSPAVQRPL